MYCKPVLLDENVFFSWGVVSEKYISTLSIFCFVFYKVKLHPEIFFSFLAYFYFIFSAQRIHLFFVCIFV